MAKIDLSTRLLNDMERVSGVAVKRLAIGEITDYVTINDDENIAGIIPAMALINKMTIVVINGFDAADATVDIRLEDEIDGTNVFKLEAIKINSTIYTPGVTKNLIHIPMPSNYTNDADGTPYSGLLGGISTRSRGLTAKLRLKSVTGVTEGDLILVVEYAYYNQKDGKYGLATVPMKI